MVTLVSFLAGMKAATSLEKQERVGQRQTGLQVQSH